LELENEVTLPEYFTKHRTGISKVFIQVFRIAEEKNFRSFFTNIKLFNLAINISMLNIRKF